MPAVLTAALLFGAGTPLAKGLLDSMDPWLLAGLLYLGSGAGLALYRRAAGAAPVRLPAADRVWLGAAILAGGVVAPVLLLYGLAAMPASAASLLLNAEGVFTALLAWGLFRENVDRRIALGMAAIVAGAVVLTWPDSAEASHPGAALAVLGACLAWAIDNNLTRKVSLASATWIAALRGWIAGSVNVAIALALGAAWPTPPAVAGAALIGATAYGASLALFVVGLRHLGTARTGAYFSTAPFFGAALAVPLLGEAVSAELLVAGGLMAFGVWLHLTERHLHEHRHEAIGHEHEHIHDEHHQHPHAVPVAPGTRHTHWHTHAPLTHTHTHVPDAHHRHRHR